MEKNIGRLRGVAGGKSCCCKMARWLIAPLWLFEVVNDFVNVILILFELVKDFLLMRSAHAPCLAEIAVILSMKSSSVTEPSIDFCPQKMGARRGTRHMPTSVVSSQTVVLI